MIRKRRTNEEFIAECHKTHIYYYSYDRTNYEQMHKSITVTCPKHGDFEIEANHHLRGHGCRKCAYDRQILKQKDTTLSFIVKAIKVHGTRYDYSKVVYGKNAINKVIITCKEHGEFNMTPNNHLRGQNCPSCSKRSSGWTKTSWRNACKGQNPKLYVIKCWNLTESFIKIGITCKTVKQRFYCKEAMPYNWEVIKEVSSEDSDYIFNLEKRIHRKLKLKKYIPKLFFDGLTECYATCH